MAVRTSVTSGLWNASDADTWGLGAGVYPHPSNDDAVIDNGHTVTLSGGSACKSLTVNTGGIYDGDGNTMEIAGESAAGWAIRFNNGSISGTDSDFDIRTAAATSIDLNCASGNARHLVINDASAAVTMETGAITLLGNLTITAGSLSTGSNLGLTVNGAADVTGTLTLNDSAVSLGALRANSGAAITQGSSGTLELTSNTAGLDAGFGDRYAFKNDDATSDINLAGTMTISNANYSLFGTAPSGASVVQNLVINTGHYWINTLTLGGTLVVNAGKHLQTYGSATGGSRAIKVTGDVTINGHLTTYKAAELDLAAEFGSLTIASGAEYTATSGTTTITGKNSSNYMFDNNGTFTHNKGTVHWKADTSSGTWYAMDGHTSSTGTEFYNISTERVRSSGTEQYRFWVGGSGRHLTVLNDIDIGVNTSVFSSNGSSVLTHLGNCYIRGTSGGLNLDNVTTVNMGIVTIDSGGSLEFADGNSINVEGIRNVGGTVVST